MSDEPAAQQDRPAPAREAKSAYPARIAVRERERIRLVSVESIVWIKADRNYCLLYTREGRFTLRATLSDLESQLNPR
ncbi:MAG TPA: LytTR family DNA-binding domain-containing protein, partial [Thermoanaerobaculia bacterium]|nr:LytTR family DNA-binding domain-containing protein [Thermoanaerobaculia bacterium]